MTLIATCPICRKIVDRVSFKKEHLNKRTIPVWHQVDDEDHHWALDEQSSVNVRRYFKNDGDHERTRSLEIGQSAFPNTPFRVSRHQFLELGL